MTRHTALTRRELLRRSSLLGLAAPALPWAGPLASLAAAGTSASAQAATFSDYRALVCIFLYGGNDAYNTVLATDSASWAAYLAARNSGSEPIALMAPGTAAVPGSSSFQATLGGVLPISPLRNQGRSLALHPTLTRTRDLFAARRLAVLANVGPLVRPITKADYLGATAPRPAKLFSHNDQQATWQTLTTEGSTPGWGGRLTDGLLASNAHANFSAISVYGSAPWLSGQQTRSYQLATSGAIHLGGNGSLFGSAVAQQKLVSLARNSRSANLIEHDHVAVTGRSVDAEATLASQLPGATAGAWGTSGLATGAIDPLLTFVNPDTQAIELNPLAQQLQAVARMIAARGTLGQQRQVFFVGLGSFDTHDGQPRRHATLLAQLDQALGYFDSTLTKMGVGSNVTTFTASDFGRAFQTNGDGCDHGWGGHHLVMGGAVKGGDLYGSFPAYGLSDGKGGFNAPQQLAAGALLPTTSVEQYAATLGRWMGVADADLLGLLPNLANTDSSLRNLGFMA